jgi:predicted metal-dependent phosphoesterase TrpH
MTEVTEVTEVKRPAGTVRVVLHAHSVWSYDGHWQLAEIARLFGRLGADAVMLTEHDTGFAPEGDAERRFGAYRAACAAASTPRCRLIPGIEYSDPANDIHILTWGLDRFLGAGRAVEATLEEVRAAGGAAVLAHPARRDAWRLFRDAWVPLLDGIEIWNRKTDGLAPGQEALRLQAATGLAPTVGVDFHRLRHFYPLDHAVDAPAGAREAGLVQAIREGRLTPRAFRRPLVRAGEPVEAGRLHRSAETARRALRDVLRRADRCTNRPGR